VIIFLLVVYIAILAILVKMKIIKPNLWWKISPALFLFFLIFILLIPMQFTSPAGEVRLLRPIVEVVPNVKGQLTEVAVTGGQKVAKGDTLFKIDPVLFQARVNQLEAKKSFAAADYKKEKTLFERGNGTQLKVDRTLAQLDEVRALLDEAYYNLQETIVVAPIDGIVMNADALRPGVRVVNVPLRSTMAIVDLKDEVLLAQFHQIYMRFIEAGQQAEIAFKYFPGQVFSGTVVGIAAGTAAGQISPSGQLLGPAPTQRTELLVRLKLNEELPKPLPAGAVGTVAVYTGIASPISIIRRVMIRMDTYLNYVIPF